MPDTWKNYWEPWFKKIDPSFYFLFVILFIFLLIVLIQKWCCSSKSCTDRGGDDSGINDRNQLPNGSSTESTPLMSASSKNNFNHDDPDDDDDDHHHQLMCDGWSTSPPPGTAQDPQVNQNLSAYLNGNRISLPPQVHVDPVILHRPGVSVCKSTNYSEQNVQSPHPLAPIIPFDLTPPDNPMTAAYQPPPLPYGTFDRTNPQVTVVDMMEPPPPSYMEVVQGQKFFN